MSFAFAPDPLVHLLLRATLAVLFASAAFHKLRDLAAFREVLRAYGVVPTALLPVAPTVAAVELALAVALVSPAWHATGALGVVAVLAVYSTAIAVNLVRGRRDIDCGCGMPGTRQPLSEWLLARNAVVAAAALATLAIPDERVLLWIDWISLAGGLAVSTCAWVAGHRLLAASHRVAAVTGSR